jgi:uncharacterized protein (DUF58 family)
VAEVVENRITKLLSNKLLSRVERMRLFTSRRFTNRSRGEHVARGGGNSNEFKDYRDYSPGDDVRFVDWNIFARHHRPFVKLFHQEEELHVVLLVDASTSMDFEGKNTRALELASSLGFMGLLGGERVSAHVFNGKGGTRMLKPIRGRGKRRELFSFLESVEPGGDGPVEEAVEAMLKMHRGRGSLIVISDFLTTGELNKPFNMAFSAGLVPYCIQILGPSELEPELSSDVRLVDSETEATLDITGTGELVGLYREYMDSLLIRLDALCKQRTGKFCSIDSGLTSEFVLTDVLRRRGWVR